jgi:hypothetical protein
MMQFEGIAAIFAVLAVLALLAGYKLLSTTSWISGWLSGNIGIFCVLLTGLLILSVLDIRSYKPMFDEKTVATLSLRELSPNHFEARIVDAMGIESRYSITGDSWYVSVNQFKWSKRLSLGMGHGYRFNKIVGLYKKNPGVENSDTISKSHYLDVWKTMNQYFPNNFFVSTTVVNTVSEPLADAAMYEIIPSGIDLVVKPMNEFAKRAQQAALQPDSLLPAVPTDAAQPTPVADPATIAPPVVPVTDIAPAAQDKTVTTQ